MIKEHVALAGHSVQQMLCQIEFVFRVRVRYKNMSRPKIYLVAATIVGAVMAGIPIRHTNFGAKKASLLAAPTLIIGNMVASPIQFNRVHQTITLVMRKEIVDRLPLAERSANLDIISRMNQIKLLAKSGEIFMEKKK